MIEIWSCVNRFVQLKQVLQDQEGNEDRHWLKLAYGTKEKLPMLVFKVSMTPKDPPGQNTQTLFQVQFSRLNISSWSITSYVFSFRTDRLPFRSAPTMKPSFYRQKLIHSLDFFSTPINHKCPFIWSFTDRQQSKYQTNHTERRLDIHFSPFCYSVFTRQHYRLSICWYFGSVWPIQRQIQMKIWWEDEVCLVCLLARLWLGIKMIILENEQV